MPLLQKKDIKLNTTIQNISSIPNDFVAWFSDRLASFEMYGTAGVLRYNWLVLAACNESVWQHISSIAPRLFRSILEFSGMLWNNRGAIEDICYHMLSLHAASTNQLQRETPAVPYIAELARVSEYHANIWFTWYVYVSLCLKTKQYWKELAPSM